MPPALHPARTVAVIAVVAATSLGLPACVPEAGSPGDAGGAASATPSGSIVSASPTTDQRLNAPASTRVAPTCDNIMDPASGKIVRDVVPPEGAVSTPTYPVLEQGPKCSTDGTVMGDFFTWSPASQTDWDALVTELTADDSAWFIEEGPRGTLLTYKIDGRYSQTFLFTGDAVILAPDKAAADFVIGPPVA